LSSRVVLSARVADPGPVRRDAVPV